MLKVVVLGILFCSVFSSSSVVSGDEASHLFSAIESVVGKTVDYHKGRPKNITFFYGRDEDGGWVDDVYKVTNNLDEIREFVAGGDSLPGPILNQVHEHVTAEYDCTPVGVKKESVKSRIFATCYSTLRSYCPSLLGQEDPRDICLHTIIAAQERAVYNAKMKRN